MTCHDYRDLMMGYLDGELNEDQRSRFEEHLSGCDECREEMAQFRKLKEITDEVTLVEPEDKMWQDYWGGIYNRIERGLGWIIFSVSGILLTIYGGFKLIEAIIEDPTADKLLKAALVALIIGLAIMFVSVLRERLYFWSRDRYRNVRR